jgi:hypothetical protein
VSDAGSLPSWIYKRDGRLVPFEPDKISQALFAATEALGRPDAFLARELADGVLHFLAQEDAAGVPTTAQVGELVAKVVRELGQPALAQTFAEGSRARETTAAAEVSVSFSAEDPPSTVVSKCLSAYSLHVVFSRDLKAAQQDGLLSLLGLEAPLQLAGYVVGSPESVGKTFAGELDVARELAQVISVDSPEYFLGSSQADAVGLARMLRPGTIVNLSCKRPPGWATEKVTGPLFAQEPPPETSPDTEAGAAALLEQLLANGQPGCRIDWHLGGSDFASDEPSPLLLRLARLAVESPLFTFTFDRPRRPVVLGEGLDRNHGGLLLAVGLHLPRLLDLPGVHGQPPVFLQKLATLGRLALSAAVQKRNYLRRQAKARAELSRGFLLDRARLLVVPVGLDAAVRVLTGCAVAEGKPGLDLGRQILVGLRDVLEEGANLDSCIDGPMRVGARAFQLVPTSTMDGIEVPLPQVAGPTPWDPELVPRQMLKAAGTLHAAAAGGIAPLFLPDRMSQQPQTIAELLQYAWQQTEIVRLQIVPVSRHEPATL